MSAGWQRVMSLISLDCSQFVPGGLEDGASRAEVGEGRVMRR